MSTFSRSLTPVLAAGALVAAIPASAVEIPYTENFNSATTTADLDFDLDGSFNVSGDMFTFDSAAGGVVGTPAVAITNADGAEFTLSSDFDLSSTNGSVGFGAFAGNDDYTSGGYYLLDLPGDGSFRILQLGSGPTETIASGGIGTGFNYLNPFTLTAGFEPGTLPTSLDLSLNVTQGALSTTISGTDATPLTGDFFGYRTRSGTAATRFTGAADNFAAVPEPGSLALAAAGGLLLARRSRTRQAAG